MAKFYIGDLHFGHRNVIQFDGRPFASVEEMDQMLIEYWKMRVQKDDEVYVLGDFCFRSDKGPVWYLRQLSGKKFLVVGNHDNLIVNDPNALSYFEDVDKMMYISDNKRQICACHFPIAEWNGYHRNSYHLYAHIHNRLTDTTLIMRNRHNAYNAGAMINNYMPSTLEEIVVNNKRFTEQYPLSWRDLPPSENDKGRWKLEG